MISRRKFSYLLGFSFSLGPFIKCSGSRQAPNIRSGGPLVLSTWNNINANETAMAVLKDGDNRLLDALEAGIKSVEANPDDQSVGYGGRPDRNGNVTLDACIMDKNGDAGSVTYVQGIRHPISLARKVMEETPHVILSGNGAQRFALSQGFKVEELLTDKSQKEYEKWLEKSDYNPKPNIEMHDTIGMLAMDVEGNISGGCSTSGLAYKMEGRVGDSPIIGAGLFIDNDIGGATATGLGELVLKTCASFLVVELMRAGKSPQEACEAAILRIVDKCKTENVQVGLIAINKKGETGAYSIRPGFVYVKTDRNTTNSKDADSYFT